MESEAVGMIEWITAVGAFATAVSLGADHLWVRRKLSAARNQDEHYRDVEAPIKVQLERLMDFAADVSDWEHGRSDQTASTIQSSGHRTSRKLNQTINLVAQNPRKGRLEWLEVKTDPLDEALSNVDEALRNLHSKTLLNEAERLEETIRSKLAASRP